MDLFKILIININFFELYFRTIKYQPDEKLKFVVDSKNRNFSQKC